jgi:hypothetical protein
MWSRRKVIYAPQPERTGKARRKDLSDRVRSLFLIDMPGRRHEVKW